MTVTAHDPAFPRPAGRYIDEWQEGDRGMDLLDYFAGQALIGVMYEHAALASAARMTATAPPSNDPALLAKYAYDVADAMVAERLRR